MNEEIREILEEISNDENYSNFIDSQNGGAEYYLLLEKAEGKQLVNYITNLQKENRINNDLIPCFKNREKELKKQINALQRENEKYKKMFEAKERFSKIMPDDTDFIILSKADYDRQQEDIELTAIKLKSRNEKAIEYIKDSGITFLNLANQRYFCNNNCADKILNILQGGDE